MPRNPKSIVGAASRSVSGRFGPCICMSACRRVARGRYSAQEGKARRDVTGRMAWHWNCGASAQGWHWQGSQGGI